jgi:hypothetical protein
MMPEHTEPLTPDRLGLREVSEFATALRCALYDVECEERSSVHYYYDADVVIHVILGFLQFDGSGVDELGLREYLVQALLPLGLLGKMRVLRPHALEIDEKLRDLLDYRTKGAQDLLQTQINQFVESRGLGDTLNHLKAAGDGIGTDSQRRSAALEILRNQAPRGFVAMALIRHGAWKTRLDASSPNVRMLFNTRELQLVRKVLDEERGAASDVNNVRDAAALASLALMIQQGQHVRFYTETKKLQSIITHHHQVHEMLLHERDSRDHPEFSVLRSTLYFLVRANFASLAFGKQDDDPLVSREDLDWLATELHAILANRPHDALRLAGRIRVGGRHLAEIIVQLNTLAFLRNVLMRAGDRLLVPDVKEWTALWDYLQGMQESDALNAEIIHVKDALRTYVKSMDGWLTNYHEIQRSAEELRKRWKPTLNPDPLRDLGLVRWNVTLDNQADERLRGLLKQLMATEREISNPACLTLAAQIEDAPGSEDAVAVTGGILWTLNLHRLTAELLREHERFMQTNGKPVRADTVVWRCAAELRAGILHRPDDIATALADVAQSVEMGLVAEGAGLFLGLGFVYYYASRHVSDENTAKVYAEKSFDAGWRASHDPTASVYVRAFGANHCAYVGTVLHINTGHTTAALQLVEELRSSPAWHYRFADTLAYAEIMEARRLLNHSPRLPDRACDHLRYARDLLAQAPHTFGDAEIDQHVNEITKLQLSAQCKN